MYLYHLYTCLGSRHHHLSSVTPYLLIFSIQVLRRPQSIHFRSILTPSNWNSFCPINGPNLSVSSAGSGLESAYMQVGTLTHASSREMLQGGHLSQISVDGEPRCARRTDSQYVYRIIWKIYPFMSFYVLGRLISTELPHIPSCSSLDFPLSEPNQARNHQTMHIKSRSMTGSPADPTSK